MRMSLATNIYCIDKKITFKSSRLDTYFFCRYHAYMAKRRGRPPKGAGKTKATFLQVRLDEAEKRAFNEAAELSGLALSAWVRERLRLLARKELEKVGRPVAFFNPPTE